MTAPRKPAKATRTPGAKAKKTATPDAHALQSPLKSRILALAQDAQHKSESAKTLASEAIHAAHECGKLLLAEKTWLLDVRDEAREKLKLLKENSQPATDLEIFWRDADWNTWYASQYEKDLPSEIADRFTRLAKTHEKQTRFDFADAPNVMRSGLLALQIYPQKEHETIANDAPLPQPASHLAVVNRFALWLATWRTKHRGPLTLTEKARLLSDFSPLCSFIEELRRV